MERLEILTIAYECESSLGNSLNIKVMTKEFLRTFLKKTAAIYAGIMYIEPKGKVSLLNSVGKSDFFDMVLENKPKGIYKYKVINILKNDIIYNCLYIALDDHYLAFIYSQENILNVNTIANIFSSLTKKINLGIKASISNERIELALLGNKDGIWDWKMNSNIVYFSPRWKEIIGYKDDEFANEFSEWEKHVHPEDFQSIILSLEKNISGETDHFEGVHRLKHKDGHWVWILHRGKAIFDENGDAIRVVGTHTDISKEKELQIKSSIQEQVIEQIHNSIISTDLTGIIIDWNQGSEFLYGYTSKEMLGQQISILFPELKSLENINNLNTTVEVIRKCTKKLIVSFSLSSLKDINSQAIGIIVNSYDITQQVELEKELEDQRAKLYHQANYDALTNLPNRVLFNDRLEQALKKAQRNKSVLAIFFIDLDRFKQINDSLGHDIGDRVLRTVTDRLESCLRREDTLARLGGDEFTIMIESLEQGQTASLLADKILKSLEEAIYIDQHELYVSCSIGISLYPDDGKSSQNLLKYADAAMYRAKDEGRNNFKFYSSEMTELAIERVVMETSLRTALKNEEFLVYYQPQIDARINKIIGIEALVRWKHPLKGIISPAKFIPLAESTGLIIQLDRYVMKTAMTQFARWHKNGLNPGVLFMNLAIKQLQKSDFMDVFKDLIKETGCKTECLGLELTEGQIMTNPEEAIKTLNQIADLGVEIAIDDFGTGYSSLAYLKKLPIKKLKIDKSFIKDLPEDEEDSAITRAVIALADSLKLDVIAEGVETKEQEEFLIKNACVQTQGYYFSKAIPAKEMESLLS